MIWFSFIGGLFSIWYGVCLLRLTSFEPGDLDTWLGHLSFLTGTGLVVLSFLL